MAAYTDSLGFNKGVAAYPAMGVHRHTVASVTLDFAKIVAARDAAGVAALAAADTLEALHVPAGTAILSAGLEVVSAETTNTTATFNLGFTGGTPAAANAYANLAASDAEAYVAAALDTPTIVTTDDTLDLLLNTAAPTDAVVRVWAVFANISG